MINTIIYAVVGAFLGILLKIILEKVFRKSVIVKSSIIIVISIFTGVFTGYLINSKFIIMNKLKIDLSSDKPINLHTIEIPFQITGAREDYDGKEFIGLKYLYRPEGIVEHEVCLIEGNYDYFLSHLSKEMIQMVWLGKIFRDNIGNIQYYEVLDVITSPEIRENFGFALKGNYIDNNYDPNIVTFVEKKREEDYWNVYYAWKVNIENEQFEKIEIVGVECMNTIFED